MCLCIYAHMCVLMYSRVYASTCVSMHLSIYLPIHLYIHIYDPVDTLTSCRAASAMMQWAGSILLQNNFSRSKKPHAPCLPPCALEQSVNPYINIRLRLEKSPMCIGLVDKRDQAIMSVHGVVGFDYKREWGSPTLVCVSLGLSCAEPAPVSWAALMLISVSVLEQGQIKRGSNVRSCLRSCTYVPISIQYMCVYMCACVRICMYKYIHTYMYIIYMYIYIYIYIYTHTKTYIYIYIYILYIYR